MKRGSMVVAIMFVVVGLVPVIFQGPAASAATFTVNSFADTADADLCGNADCTLREAILAANKSPDADIITLPAGTYNLTISGTDDTASAGDLDILHPVTITGAGAPQTIVDGAGGGDRVFHVLAGATASISGLTIRNGDASGGGGLLNHGDATLTDATVTGNDAGLGGGIRNTSDATLTLVRVTITDNDAGGGGRGAGLNNAGDATITGSTISGNRSTGSNGQAGGIYNTGTVNLLGGSVVAGNHATGDGGGVYNTGTASFTDASLRDNTATRNGGAITNSAGGRLTVLRSEVTGNRGCIQGTAILNSGSGAQAEITASVVSANTSSCSRGWAVHTDTFGTLTIVGSTIAGNAGSGLVGSQSARASVESTTISGNSGAGVGSLLNGVFDMRNVTISGNGEAGISTSVDAGKVTVEWSTITGNGGGGIDSATDRVTALASIVAGNTGSDCSILASQGFVLLGSAVGCTFTQAASDIVGVDPKLGPLQNHSTPRTHALLPGSPALDAVPAASCTSVPTDQRGVARPQGPACDIGAFEAGPEHTVGLVDPGQGQWHLRNSVGQVTSFFFGNPGDFPIMGDWDCDGTDTPGMYRQSDGFVYLSNANSSQVADIRFFFGDPGDVPLAGDFDGDGCDTVSIYRPDEGRFFIINKLGQNEGGLGAAEFDYLFGDPGDKPFVGDFDGDGVETVGLHRESTGLVYFRQTHTQGVADAQFIFGDPGDRLVAGDWGVVDGAATPALFRPSNTTFFFRHTNTQGVADDQLVFGTTSWLPVAGVFGLG